MLAVAGLAALAASGGRALAARPAQGVFGTVTVSLPAAVCQAGEDCTRALVGATVAFLRDGRTAATVRTNDEGGYRVALPAGRYSIAVRPKRARVEVEPHEGGRAPITLSLGSKVVRPRTVSVARGRFRHVDVRLELALGSPQR